VSNKSRRDILKLAEDVKRDILKLAEDVKRDTKDHVDTKDLSDESSQKISLTPKDRTNSQSSSNFNQDP